MSRASQRALWIGLLLACAPGLTACQRAEKVDSHLGRVGALVGRISLSDDAEPTGVTVVAVNRQDAAQRGQADSARDGTYRIATLPVGEYDVTASKTGYEDRSGIATIEAGRETTLDFELAWIPVDVPDSIAYVSGGSNGGDADQTGVVGRLLAEPFVVEVRDAGGQPLSDVQVIFQIVEGLSGGDMQVTGWMSTDVDGRVYNTYRLGEAVGENQIRVQALGLQDQHVDFTPLGLADEPDHVELVSGDRQAAVVGQPLADPVALTVRDRFDNPVPGAGIQLEASDGGSTEPAAAQADDGGQAQVTWTLGTRLALEPDHQTLTIRSGQAEAQAVAFADHDLAAGLLKAGGDHQSGRPNEPFAEPLLVEAQDGYGNPVDGVEVMLAVTEGQCNLTPATPPALLTDSAGRVSVQAEPTSFGVIRVQASAQGLSPVVFDLTAVSGQPGQIEPSSGQDQWGHIGQTLAAPFRFRLVDSFENPVGDVWLHFEAGGLQGTPGSADPQEVKTDAGGYAEVSLTLGTAAGADAQWIAATALGFPQIAAARIYANVFADPASQLTIVSGDLQTQSFGQQLPEPLVVRTADPYDNPVAGVEVSWSSDTGGQVTPNPSVTDEQGEAYGLATLGADPLQADQRFTASIAGASVTFAAQGIGHHIDRLLPASVPPGYPDLDDPAPQNTLVPIQALGGGFEAGAVVIWDAWGTPEEVTPQAVAAERIDFELSADHFAVGREGVYMVAVRNPDGTDCAAVPFAVTLSVPDSGQTQEQCTEYVYTGPGGWEWQLRPCADFQPGADWYGQDGHYHSPTNQPDFTNNADGTVTDNLTGLMWTRCAAGQNPTSCAGLPGYFDQQEAIAHCQDLVFAGHDDWLLPRVVELVQIADYSRSLPVLDPAVFPDPPSEGFWSADLYGEQPPEAFRWLADQGWTEAAAVDQPDGVVRCVRNRRAEPPGRFVRTEPLPDEPVVTDGQTGLVWQGCASGLRGADCDQGAAETYPWQDALAYCEGLSWAGASDWRLPQIKELVTLVDFGHFWPAVDPALFPNTPLGWSLSSTNLIGTFYWSAASVLVSDGTVGNSFKDSWDFAVRCVRRDF